MLAEELSESLEQPVPQFSEDSVVGDARGEQSFFFSAWPVKGNLRLCSRLG